MELLTIIVLAALLALRESLHHIERAQLLDRIQSPERVIHERLPIESKLADGFHNQGPWEVPPEAVSDGIDQA